MIASSLQTTWNDDILNSCALVFHNNCMPFSIHIVADNRYKAPSKGVSTMWRHVAFHTSGPFYHVPDSAGTHSPSLWFGNHENCIENFSKLKRCKNPLHYTACPLYLDRVNRCVSLPAFITRASCLWKCNSLYRESPWSQVSFIFNLRGKQIGNFCYVLANADALEN